MRPRAVAVGDRVRVVKSLPAVQWVDANDLERAVIGGVHRSPGAEGTVEYLTRGPKGAFSVEVRHDDGNLAPYLANELDDVCAMSTPVDTSDWLSWAVEIWNQRVPVGASVALTEDNGSITDTVTRSEAWHLGDGTPVVKVDGRTGGYLLRRILPIGPRQVTEGDAGLVQRMRDCLLELAGEPAESETIAELIQRVRETVRRPAQIVMKLLADLEAHDFVDIASQLGDDTIPQLYVADALKALAACKSGEQTSGTGWFERKPAARGTIAEQLWQACDEWERELSRARVSIELSEKLAAIIRQTRDADPARFAETDIAQIVGRLVALEAAVFDEPRPQADSSRLLNVVSELAIGAWHAIQQGEWAPSGLTLEKLLQWLDDKPHWHKSIRAEVAGIERVSEILASEVGHGTLRTQAEEAVARLRGNDSWQYIASEEHKAVEEASVILAKLAPGLGSASLKEQAEEIRRRFALLAQEWQAVAAMTSGWREDSIPGSSARAVWHAHHRARKAVSGISVGDVL